MGKLLDEKLTKLLPMLASDKPGEVVAAAAAITRALEAGGTDWHDLTARLASPRHNLTEGEPAPIWQTLARAVMFTAGSCLSETERQFIFNMSRARLQPSAAQIRWLHALAKAAGISTEAA